MSPQSIREEGFSKDADKLVRRLSLVALLLSRRGQPVTAAEIRSRVEGYPLMTEEAFKRRFFEDRDELKRLGIEIRADQDPFSDTSTELYSLPADAYYLEPVELDGEELAALAACLAVLEHRFAYSQPLRLALLSLAQGRPELLTEAEAPPLTVVPETREPAAALPKLQAAAAERKTVEFEYYAITRDETMLRTVDPYGLQLVAGEWYLIGWDHLREDLRTFRLSRIRSKVKHHTKRPHDFTPPADFDLATYRDRPAWQLAEPRGSARIRVSPVMAWWVAAHWAHCGAVEQLDDGAIVYETPYADARPLLSWVLGLGDEAELLEPAGLRTRIAGELDALEQLLDAPAPERSGKAPAVAKAPAGRRRRPDDDLRVEVDRFTRLTALTSYLLRRCKDDEALLDVADVRADLGVTADELRQDVRLLNLVNFGADGALLYAEFEGRNKLSVFCDLAGPALRRPARLSPLQADTLLLAVDLVGNHLPTTTGAALSSAADKLRAARGGHQARGLQRPPAPRRRAPHAGQPSHRGSPPARHRVLDRGHRPRHEARGRAVPARAQPRRVVLRLLVPHRRRHARVPRGHHQAGRAARRDVRAARGRRAGRVPARGHPHVRQLRAASRRPCGTARWWRAGSPSGSRWSKLADGSCVASQPYVDVRWLAAHLLRFADQARPLDPPEAVDGVRAAVRRLRERYA